jgi:hypothetical protein
VKSGEEEGTMGSEEEEEKILEILRKDKASQVPPSYTCIYIQRYLFLYIDR